jgi:hypothetical protein
MSALYFLAVVGAVLLVDMYISWRIRRSQDRGPKVHDAGTWLG